jgi:transketolase
MSAISNEELRQICAKTRRLIMDMIYQAGSGHVGGALSVVEIIATLYYRTLKIDPSDPRWENRDRFVLSKGHAGPALYAILAQAGFFPEVELMTLNHDGTNLPSHADMRRTRGIDMTTGALGQGLSAAVGMALSAKLDGRANRVFVLLGDGELNEGQNWEAAMTAAKYRLNNLIAVVDDNKLQIDGACLEVMPLEPLAAKWAAFGWQVLEVDGHDLERLAETFDQAATAGDAPVAVLARTHKGRGVSFAEDQVASHNMRLTQEQWEQSRRDLAGA